MATHFGRWPDGVGATSLLYAENCVEFEQGYASKRRAVLWCRLLWREFILMKRERRDHENSVKRTERQPQAVLVPNYRRRLSADAVLAFRMNE